VLQLALQWPFYGNAGVKLKFRFNFRHPGLKQIGLLMIPACWVRGYQTTINVFCFKHSGINNPRGPRLLSRIFFYADRIMELPLGVFAIAIGTAVLPSFSMACCRR